MVFAVKSYQGHKPKSGKKGSLFSDIYQLLSYVNLQRKRQILWLIVLMILSALSEIVSLGSVFPFLGALSNPELLLANPKAKPFLDKLGIDSPQNLVTSLAIIFIAAVITANLLRIVTIRTRNNLSTSMASDISCHIYRKTLFQPYKFHIKSSSSDLISLLSLDTKILTNNILIPLFEIATNMTIFIAIIFALFLIDGRVAIISATTLSGTYFILYQRRKIKLIINSKIVTGNSQRQIQTIQESIGGIQNVLIGHCQNFFIDRYENADRPMRQAIASNTTAYYVPRYTVEMLAMSLIAILALTLGQDGDFSQAIPVLGSLAVGGNRLLPAIQQSFAALVKIQGCRSSLKRILNRLSSEIDPIQQINPREPLPFQEKLTFQDVWFQYDELGEWILKDLNFEIESGSTVGFIGTTGSGKSTTANLLLGLLQPQQGKLSVDGRILQGGDLRAWQKNVAYVPQRIFLADTTITENIAFGIPLTDIDFHRVQEAARLAKISEFIDNLPAKYETYIGEHGVRLSGGQQQRIGIARAIYRNASVIVFDEATSALDNLTEQEVMQAIQSMGNSFTIILIAHRLTTLESCDRIFRFEKGYLTSVGTYKNLMDDTNKQ